jgi:oxygen-dependent protoporphyrinogen oxidase
MTACSVGSAKWPHWADGHVVLRLSAGRAGDDRAMGLDDGELVGQLDQELRRALQATEGPRAVRVSRWPDGFPQYAVGHVDRVGAIESALAADVPGVLLAGASYHGVGIPACIASGRAAARAALAYARPAADRLRRPMT